MARVLVVDDDISLCELMCLVVGEMGHGCAMAHTYADGLELALTGGYDLVLMDMILPDGNGLDALPVLAEMADAPEVVVITGVRDAGSAEMAIKSGVWDYVSKPASLEEYRRHIKRALEYRAQKRAAQSRVAASEFNIIGRSPAIKACTERLALAAAGEASVLISGQTGTGKELFARAVHDLSHRREGPFVVVDCAAMPENLVESMLFGHEKGAFTSAVSSRTGLIKHADTGTLFLDEVGELPLALQKAFLRVLQERKFRPVGGSREVVSDFRLVAATNKDLAALAKTRRFREDLLYRLKSFTIDLPPLKQRASDIRLLSRYHLADLARRYGVAPKEAGEEFMSVLEGFPWPGNVRELFNTLEQVFTANIAASALYPSHLPEHVRVHAARAAMPESGTDAAVAAGRPTGILPTFKEFRDRAVLLMERDYLRSLVTSSKGDIAKAMDISGLSRSRLYALLKKHGIRKHF